MKNILSWKVGILSICLLSTLALNAQTHSKNTKMASNNNNSLENCDIETGLCTPANAAVGQATMILKTPKLGAIIYVGDPMCSWCWGIAKELEELKNHYAADYDFELIMGGLRPGGGEEWNSQFQNFLRGHWVHIQEKTGQPFSFDLLEKDQFNYDTEPACRAVRVVRDMATDKELDFFKAIQYRFYYENQDPKTVEFYKNICEKMELDFESFSSKFLSEKYKKLVREDFVKSADMGVRGFPTIVLQKGEEYYLIANGYVEFDLMRERIDSVK